MSYWKYEIKTLDNNKKIISEVFYDDNHNSFGFTTEPITILNHFDDFEELVETFGYLMEIFESQVKTNVLES
jgi:hypothetical protein